MSMVERLWDHIRASFFLDTSQLQLLQLLSASRLFSNLPACPQSELSKMTAPEYKYVEFINWSVWGKSPRLMDPCSWNESHHKYWSVYIVQGWGGGAMYSEATTYFSAMRFAGYVIVCVQLYCVSCPCLTLHVSAYMLHNCLKHDKRYNILRALNVYFSKRLIVNKYCMRCTR
jgi:hypothetical protein